MTTAPLPTSHQAATAALSDLLGSAPIWSEHDVDLARTLLLFGGAAAEAALLAWVEAQHAYPHALLAHVAGALSPGGQERVGRHVRAMCPGPWRDQALSRCVDYLPPSALNDLISTVLAWQPREPASGDNDTITPHASATALRALGLALAAQQRVDAALALANSIADGHARVRAFAQLLKIVPTDLRDGLWREIVLMLRELDGASAFVALDEARADLIRGGQARALISFLRDDKLPPFPRQTLLHHLAEDLQESRPDLALEAARQSARRDPGQGSPVRHAARSGGAAGDSARRGTGGGADGPGRSFARPAHRVDLRLFAEGLEEKRRMCRAYGTASRAYIRACYRTGQPGLKVPTDQAVWGDNGHLDLSGLAVTPGTKPDGVMQHYRVPRAGLAEVIADVERRYQPRSVLFTELGGQLYASLHLPRALPAISARMATFGWVAEPARDGLPLPPERAVTRRPRRGRVEHYALVVVFDTEPGAETLAALAEIPGDDPAHHRVRLEGRRLDATRVGAALGTDR